LKEEQKQVFEGKQGEQSCVSMTQEEEQEAKGQLQFQTTR